MTIREFFLNNIDILTITNTIFSLKLKISNSYDKNDILNWINNPNRKDMITVTKPTTFYSLEISIENLDDDISEYHITIPLLENYIRNYKLTEFLKC